MHGSPVASVPCVCVSNYAVYIETVGYIPVGLVGYEVHGQDDCLKPIGQTVINTGATCHIQTFIIAVFAYTLYNISFTILDAHVTNTSPIHHQTLFMMYKYVKNNSNIHVLACNIKIKIKITS